MNSAGKQRHRLSGRSLIVATASALCLMAASSTASATCGDYLTAMGSKHSDWSPGAGRHHVAMRHGQAKPIESASDKRELPAGNLPGPCSCQGSTCSRGDLPGLPAAPGPDLKSFPEQWAFVALRSMIPAVVCRPKAGAASAMQPTPLGSSIFRPPRLVVLCG